MDRHIDVKLTTEEWELIQALRLGKSLQEPAKFGSAADPEADLADEPQPMTIAEAEAMAAAEDRAMNDRRSSSRSSSRCRRKRSTKRGRRGTPVVAARRSRGRTPVL